MQARGGMQKTNEIVVSHTTIEPDGWTHIASLKTYQNSNTTTLMHISQRSVSRTFGSLSYTSFTQDYVDAFLRC